LVKEKIDVNIIPIYIKGIVVLANPRDYREVAYIVRILVNFIRRYGILKSRVTGDSSHKEELIRIKIREFCDHNSADYKRNGFEGIRSISLINSEQYYSKIKSVEFVGLFDTFSSISKDIENMYDYFIYPEFVNKSCHTM
jgi:hypothetical protein